MITLISMLFAFRNSFNRERSFLWFCVMVIGFCLGTRSHGVTSITRNLGLDGAAYGSLLHLFCSSAWSLKEIQQRFVLLVLDWFKGYFVTLNGRYLILGDSINIAKEGKKMPGVKLLHQSSQSNSKSEWIMGHFIHALSLVVQGTGKMFSVPLVARIDEGYKLSNFDKNTRIDKFGFLLGLLPFLKEAYVIADCYYFASKLAKLLVGLQSHLITRVKTGMAVAYQPAPKLSHKKTSKNPKGAGRKPKYGTKIKLKNLFSEELKATELLLYGEQKKIRYWVKDLLWKDYGGIVRYVGVVFPDGGKAIFMSTDVGLTPEEIIQGYSYRFKIEVSFKSAVHTIGSFAYHFWMKGMERIRSRSKGQYLHKKGEEYRERFLRKLESLERFIFVGFLAQALLQYLSIKNPMEVWRNMKSFYRTIDTSSSPSEEVVKSSLTQGFSNFIKTSLCGHPGEIIREFLKSEIDKAQEIKNTGKLSTG